MNTNTSLLFRTLVIAACFICLLARINGVDLVEESLLGDDGFLFINQSHEHGIRSLWMPYAGYHFLYQRLIALASIHLPSIAIPYIFFISWLLSFFSAAYVLMVRGKSLGLSDCLIVVLVCAIALQPTNVGGSFFFLSNAHFFLGIALCIHICTPSTGRPPSAAEIPLLIVASLSGPVSALMTILLVVQQIICRDFALRRATYTIVLLGGLTQIICILGSQRFNNVYEVNLAHWARAIESFLRFGTDDNLCLFSAASFWSLSLILMIRWVYNRENHADAMTWLAPLFLTASAFAIFLLTGFSVSVRPSLPAMNPLHWEFSRYFLIPYSLSFYSAVVCARDHQWAQIAIVSLLGIICASTFSTTGLADRASTAPLLSRVNLQWTAYARFQKIRTDLLIPINPPWAVYPPFWSAQLGRKNSTIEGEPKADSYFLVTPETSPLNSYGTRPDDTVSDSEAPHSIYINVDKRCPMSRYLALEIYIWRSRMGWARVSWGTLGNFDIKHSLERFYLDGSTIMQFAFRRDVSDEIVKIDPTEGVPDSPFLRQMEAPGFKEFLSYHGVVGGAVTAPGGEFRIEEIRLFCLG